MKTYTVTVDDKGITSWYLNGKLHRENGPAIEAANGDKLWFFNDKLHRENGPAIEYADSRKWWYINGKLHRENGPAVEYANGSKAWFFNDKEYTEEEFNKLINKNLGPIIKVIEIDGVKYELKKLA